MAEEGGEREEVVVVVMVEVEREGGAGVAVEAEPPLGDEGDGGERKREAVEDFDEELIAEDGVHP